MDMPMKIDSDTEIPLEEHFKVSAGPGAGKTTFLVNHIQHILRESKRLSSMRKIACITYTNVGVDTLKSRLGDALDNIEISTIHSFLYKHVLKPYLWVLADEYKFDYAAIDGHDEVVPGYSICDEWKKKTNQVYLHDTKQIGLKLMKLRWRLDENDKLKLEFPRQYDGMANSKDKSYHIIESSFLEYKRLCWERGLISHDDVLALSLMIIDKEMRTLEILRGKFPYFLVDEFQDTNPIQTRILMMLAARESIVGVIGDACQSIFSFQGADVKQFVNFSIPNMNRYIIENNKRSTTEIIDILNNMRLDLHQISPDDKHGDKPILFVGDSLKAYAKALDICGEKNLYVLAYAHESYRRIQFGCSNESKFDKKLIDYLQFNDTERGKMIIFLIYALEYAKNKCMRDAIKYIRKAFKMEYRKDNFDDRDGLILLGDLLHEYDMIKGMPIDEFYNTYIYGVRGIVKKITRGNIKEYYTGHTYQEVACTISLEDSGYYRSIHQSKGSEFDNVLVIIPQNSKGENLDFILNPDMDKETNRVYYVALSRAVKRLFISTPSIIGEDKERLVSIGLDVIKC